MLILNPFTHELLIPLALAFCALLGTGLFAVLTGSLFVKDGVLRQQLILRWLSWAIIAPLTLLSILAGPLVFAVLCSIISVICTGEFCAMTRRGLAERVILTIAAALLPLVACQSVRLLAGVALLAAILLTVVNFRKTISFESASVSLVALAYVPLLVSHAVLLYKMSVVGPALLISIVTASAMANILAFLFGKLFAGPKIAPEISPNKTWWGVAGSICGACLGFALLSAASHLKLSLLSFWLISIMVALVGVVGDLFESFIKRSCKVKDAGRWLPGFGGALDRVDGLLFVLPCVYYFIAPSL